MSEIFSKFIDGKGLDSDTIAEALDIINKADNSSVSDCMRGRLGSYRDICNIESELNELDFPAKLSRICELCGVSDSHDYWENRKCYMESLKSSVSSLWFEMFRILGDVFALETQSKGVVEFLENVKSVTSELNMYFLVMEDFDYDYLVSCAFTVASTMDKVCGAGDNYKRLAYQKFMSGNPCDLVRDNFKKQFAQYTSGIDCDGSMLVTSGVYKLGNGYEISCEYDINGEMTKYDIRKAEKVNG